MKQTQFDPNEMVGKKYMYMGNEIKILQIGERDGEYYVQTEKRQLKVSKKELQNEFLPCASDEEASMKLVLYKGYEESRIQVKSLSTILMETINKLKDEKGKEYIEQAQEINNTAKTMIELRKSEIEMARLMKEFGQ